MKNRLTITDGDIVIMMADVIVGLLSYGKTIVNEKIKKDIMATELEETLEMSNHLYRKMNKQRRKDFLSAVIYFILTQERIKNNKEKQNGI